MYNMLIEKRANNNITLISGNSSGEKCVPVDTFLKDESASEGWIILKISVPSLTDQHHLRSYKVTQRAQVKYIHTPKLVYYLVALFLNFNYFKIAICFTNIRLSINWKKYIGSFSCC